MFNNEFLALEWWIKQQNWYTKNKTAPTNGRYDLILINNLKGRQR